MVPRNRAAALKGAWDALDASAGSDGWRTIAIETGAFCSVMAGRRFPENQEAVLFGFRSARLPLPVQLPQGRGFVVAAVGRDVTMGELAWVALSRAPSANLEHFLLMVADLITTLESGSKADEDATLLRLLNRIRSWQFFMERDRAPVLGREAEVGLFGELVVFENLLSCGVPPGAAVDIWRGPLDELHDFRVGSGAIEVKSTSAASRFPAYISPIEQLDSSDMDPLYLAAVRLTDVPSGQTLPERIDLIREELLVDGPALESFDLLLLQAGFLTSMADRYRRRMSPLNMRLMKVSAEFPRLMRSHLPTEILEASYTLDLSLIQSPELDLSDVLVELGVITNAT